MRNTGTEYGSADRTPVVLPELAELLPPLTGEQLAALEERTFAGMEVLQREVSGQELPDRFRLEGVYLCVEDIGEEREILTGEEIPGLEPPAGAVKGAE